MKRNRNTRWVLWSLFAAVLLIVSTPARAQSVSATPQNVAIAKGEAQGSTLVTWSAGSGIKSLGAQLWQRVNGGKETLVSANSKGSQSVAVKAGETRVFKLYNFNKSRLLASVTVTATQKDAAPADGDEPDNPKPIGGAVAGGDDAPNDDDGDTPDDAPVSFAGTWPTLAAGTTEFTVRLQQVGNKVTGSYSPGNGKIFDGLVVGRKLTFKWKQAPDWEGTSEFTMDKDGKGFKGSTTALKPQQFSHYWNSYVPEPLALAGVWETTSNNAPFTLTLQQTGDKVTGTYTPGSGTLEGTLTNNILRFKWTSDGAEGSGRFVFAKNEMEFSGSYSNTDDPEQADGLWSGKRKMGGGGGKTISFSGVWNASYQTPGDTVTLTLKQTGGDVTGYCINHSRLGDSRSDVVEGKVDGKTLRFKSRDHDDGKITGSAELVLGADGKSFTGNILTNPVAGVFARKLD